MKASALSAKDIVKSCIKVQKGMKNGNLHQLVTTLQLHLYSASFSRRFELLLGFLDQETLFLII